MASSCLWSTARSVVQWAILSAVLATVPAFAGQRVDAASPPPTTSSEPGALTMPSAAVTVTDDRGTTHTFGQPVQRIVSLLPSWTETVCAIGACDRLVGVDAYSNFPPRVNDLPRLGGVSDSPVEAIVRLRPDVVLASRRAMATTRLEALGINVLEFEPHSHADLAGVIERIGAVAGQRARAADLQHRLQAGLRAAAARLQPALRGQSVYIEIGAGPYAAGPRSFIGETVAQLGLRNILDASLGPWPRINPEVLLHTQPDWIIAPESIRDSMGRRPGTALLRAWPARTCLIPREYIDAFVRPGPRLADAAAWLADCLNDATMKTAR